VKLIRFGERGREKPGVLLDGMRKDCSQHFADWNPAFFADGGVERLRALLAKRPSLPDVAENARWGSCVARPGKLICIGLNYRDHAAESGMPIPAEPIVFMKAANTVVGPYDTVLIPRGSQKTDWEVELVVVIGADARYLATPAAARAHIAGYCIGNDVSERAFQLERGGQWTKGKSCDTFNPLGPWLSTSDEIDPGALDMHLDVNGVRKQTGNTRTLIFDVTTVVHYLSQFMTLEAGDIISTGTPPGVGLGQKPEPQYLKRGDVMELTIAGLGSQRQICENA
jgi:2,4-didehydro-3-deoxy-L-rhamnonate hydrolase